MASYIALSRVRGIAIPCAFAIILFVTLGGTVLPLPEPVTGALGTLSGLLIVVGIVTAIHPGAPTLPARTLDAPLQGRWIALNSPADKRPSHGTHGSGQTFAIDLVYEEGRPGFGTGPGFRPPTDFPAFDQPVFAPADAVVAKAVDGARDHGSRSNWTAYAYMMLEGIVRGLAGGRFLLGNHLVLELDDGAYVALAHLRRGSLEVRVGDRVHSGQVIARCGNSGNSSEPHLHIQVMDIARAAFAAGLPFTFRGHDLPGGLPRNGEAVTFEPVMPAGQAG
jgi:murein DD-endopeptidase MepM/ murein hydrolase activator NlpD